VSFVALGAELTARPGATHGAEELHRSFEEQDIDADVYDVTIASGIVTIDGPQTSIEEPVKEAGPRLLNLLVRLGG
jgi:hypothetical protein